MRRCLPSKTALFVLLSGADLLLTCYLLRDANTGAYEANWFAAYVLDLYGQSGLALFKGLVVLLVGTLIYVVARYRPVAAQRLAVFACAAPALVVVHSIGVCVHLATDSTDLSTAEQTARLLDHNNAERQKFRVALGQYEQALAAGETTLDEAISALALFEASSELAGPLRYYAATAGTSHDERLAALVMFGTLFQLRRENSPTALERATELLATYRASRGPAFLDYIREAYPDLEGPAAEAPAPGTLGEYVRCE